MATRKPALRPGHDTSRPSNRLSLEQLEARLMFAIDGADYNLQVLATPTVGATSTTPNAPPTIATTPRIVGGTEVRGRSATVTVLGADDQGESGLRYTWRATQQPTPDAVRFAANGINSAKNNTLTFSRAGDYAISVTVVDPTGLSTTRSLQFRVIPALSSFLIKSPDGRTITTDSAVQVTGTTARFSAQALDQFGIPLAQQPTINWQTTIAPSGGRATFENDSSGTKVTFNRAGLYTLRAQSGSQTFNIPVNVNSVLRTLQVTTPTGTIIDATRTLVVTEATQRLVVRGIDQFNQPMTVLPSLTWTTLNAPTGGRLTTTKSNSIATLTFNRAGVFSLRATGGSAAFMFSAEVTPSLASLRVVTTENRTLSTTSPLNTNNSTIPLTAVGIDQFGNILSPQPSISWQTTSRPGDNTVTLTGDGSTVTAQFAQSGSYGFRATSGNRTANVTVNVGQTMASFGFVRPDGQPVEAESTITIGASVQRLNVRGFDQFGGVLTTPPTVTWAALSVPDGASFTASTSNGVVTLNFSKLGMYSLQATNGNATFNFKAEVVPSLAGFRVVNSSNVVVPTTTVYSTSVSTEQFTAIGLDQYNTPLANQPVVEWSVVSGPVENSATLTPADNSVSATFARAGAYVLRAQSGNRLTNISISVSQNLTSLVYTTPSGAVAKSEEPIAVASDRIRLAVSAVDQFNSPLATLPSISATVISAPANGLSTIRVETASVTFLFGRAGTYVVRLMSGSQVTFLTFNVVQTFTSAVALSSENRVISGSTAATVTSTAQTITAQALDQFGQPLTEQPAFTWSTLVSPTTDSATITTGNNQAKVQFSEAGRFVFRATSGNRTVDVTTNVVQTATAIRVTPGTAQLDFNATQLFRANALDQFDKPLSTSPTFTWSSTGGTILSSGIFSSGSRAGTFTVSAKVGLLAGSATVTVVAPTDQTTLKNADIAALVQSYYADSQIDRNEMIEILRRAGTDGVVDSTELSDFRFIVSADSNFVMPNYVRELARDVVNENPANLKFKGQTAGNLIAGSSSTLLNNLVNKWFLGADQPAMTESGLTYQVSVGNLFNSQPSHADARQGMLGDCYFIASLVSIADRNPDAVRNMFIDNGDNTYTVRFFGGALGYYLVGGSYTAGFSSGTGVADYVTVDRRLPAYSDGSLAYSGYGQSVSSSSTTLWIALAEKAYAQWNETKNSGRDGTNRYESIEGGWMSDVNAQVLGYNSTNYSFSNTPKQTLVDALNSGRSVTFGTNSAVNAGLVGGHAYIITRYDAGADRFTVYNPWGTVHPDPLTWSQLQSNGSMFVVTNSAGAAIANASSVKGSADELLIGNWTTVVTSEALSSLNEKSEEHASIATVDSAPFEKTVFVKGPEAVPAITITLSTEEFFADRTEPANSSPLDDIVERLDALDLLMASLSM